LEGIVNEKNKVCTFEVFLVVRLLGILPVIALVAVDFTHYLDNQGVGVVGVWGIHNRWRRGVIIVGRWIFGWWWRSVVVRSR